MYQFLLATRNSGKVTELRALLSDVPVELIGLDETGIAGDVDETGSTFAENARLKAISYARMSGLHSIADDSGLEVAALGGRPGVYSARYAGEGSGFGDKIRKLLDEMLEIAPVDRTARFVSHIAIAEPSGSIIHEAEGICSGTIAFDARGSNGFGYDPVFIPNGFDQTFGELNDMVKGTISHRARAIAKIIRFLRVFA